MSRGAELLSAAASTAKISAATGVALTTVQRWRSGALVPPPDRRQELEAKFQIPPAAWDDLLYDTAPAPPGALATAPVPDDDVPIVTLDEAHAQLRRVRRWRSWAEAEGSGADKRAAFEAERKAIELVARLDGAYAAGADESKLVATPRWQAIRAALLDALQPYPDATAAVVEALHALDA